MRALLLSLTLLLVTAPAAFAQGEIDAAAEGLRSDPVYVDPDAEAQLSTSEQDELRDRIAKADTPVYIAVLPASAADEAGGSATDVARQVADGVGRSGSYGIVVGRKLIGGPSSGTADAAGKAAAEHKGE